MSKASSTVVSKESKSAPAKEKKSDVKDHPDAAYIKREDIGVVVAKGLAVMYKT